MTEAMFGMGLYIHTGTSVFSSAEILQIYRLGAKPEADTALSSIHCLVFFISIFPFPIQLNSKGFIGMAVKKMVPKHQKIICTAYNNGYMKINTSKID